MTNQEQYDLIWEKAKKYDRLEMVLDKIKAEIMELQTYKMFVGENTVYSERDDVLAIIDKYRESEEVEEG